MTMYFGFSLEGDKVPSPRWFSSSSRMSHAALTDKRRSRGLAVASAGLRQLGPPEKSEAWAKWSEVRMEAAAGGSYRLVRGLGNKPKMHAAERKSPARGDLFERVFFLLVPPQNWPASESPC